MEINKKQRGKNNTININNKMKEYLNGNINSNLNDSNEIVNSTIKKNEDDLCRKNNDISNLGSKNTSEEEVYENKWR